MAYNEVTRSANVTENFWGSAISTYANYYIDRFTGVKNVIRGNIIYSNTNKPKANCVASGCSNSDGSGIIIDDLKNSQHATSSDYVPPYIYGVTVVENNITYNNGGRGISIFSSNNVIVRSNTSYQNNKDPFEGAHRPGEINSESSSNVEIYNNIAYSDGLNTINPSFGINTGAHVGISISNSANVKLAGNLTYNSQNNQINQYYVGDSANVVIESANEVWADPLFIANFQLNVLSPAFGMHLVGKGAPIDYFNRIRSIKSAAGAY